MYVASGFDRQDKSRSGFASDMLRKDEALDRERREFIRTAAIKIAACPDQSVSIMYDKNEAGQRNFQSQFGFPDPKHAVARAKALWAELLAQDC